MANKSQINVTYEIDNVIQPFYTGGTIALDAECRILVTSISEETLLSDLRTGKILARIEGDGEVLTTLILTPSASHLITCSRSLFMKTYSLSWQDSDTIEATLVRSTKPHPTPVVVAAVDTTGSLIATGAADGTIKIWDIAGGFVTHSFHSHHGVVSALHFFSVPTTTQILGGQKVPTQTTSKSLASRLEETAVEHNAAIRLASGYNDGQVRIWDLLKRKSIALLNSHASVVSSFDYCPKQQLLISSSRDKTIAILNAATWKSPRIIPIYEELEAVSFLGTSGLVYTAGESGNIKLWNLSTGAQVTAEQNEKGELEAITQTVVNTKHKIILSVHASHDLLLHSWLELDTDTPSKKISHLPVLCRISGTHDEVIDMAYVGRDKTMMALATNTEHVRLISLHSSTAEEPTFENPSYFGSNVASLEGHTDIIICIAVDASGGWLATGAKDNTARLWRIDQAEQRYECYAAFSGHAESLGAVCLPASADLGDQTDAPAYLITGSQDKTIKRWTIPRVPGDVSKALYTRKAHDKDINCIASSPNGNLFATGSQDRTAKIWSTEEGESQGVLRGHKRGVWTVQFAPATLSPLTSDGGATTKSGKGLILTGSGDRSLKVWNLSDYSCIRTFEGHPNSILKALWLQPDRSEESAASDSLGPARLLSAGSDGLVKVWDPNTGECLTTLDNHTERVWTLAIHPQSKTVVSAGGDGIITFWKDTSHATAARQIADSNARIEQDQILRNHERAGNWRDAIVLALQLGHPQRLLSLFQRVIELHEPESIMGVREVDDVLGALDDEQLVGLLGRVRDWNTNTRLAPVAQRILHVVLAAYSPDCFVRLGKRRGGRAVLDALRAYTERHFRRVEDLAAEGWIVEYLLAQMDQLDVMGRGVEVGG